MGEDSLLLHSWNAFNASNQLSSNYMSNTDPFNYSSVGKQSAHYLSSGYSYGKADMLKGIISRIALDSSMVEFKHLKINEKDGNQNGGINTPGQEEDIEDMSLTVKEVLETLTPEQEEVIEIALTEGVDSLTEEGLAILGTLTKDQLEAVLDVAYQRREIERAEANPAVRNDILAKRFNIPGQQR